MRPPTDIISREMCAKILHETLVEQDVRRASQGYWMGHPATSLSFPICCLNRVIHEMVIESSEGIS